MSELSQADRFLLTSVQEGDADAWAQLVDRFRGRLLAFARSRLPNAADAEDLLQDTFLRFLKALPSFRGEAGLETYLFTILRRRIADWYRGRRFHVCLLQDLYHRPGRDEPDEPLRHIPARDPSASFYARRDEQDEVRRRALATAIRALLRGYKEALKFGDLKIVEMLFYCQLTNTEVAKVAGVSEKQVALVKHRSLKKVRRKVAQELGRRGADSSVEAAEAHGEPMLAEVWETHRLSCPKRSTIGAYLLRTLDAPWEDYVDFHLHKLGCRFCLANLADLRRQTRAGAPSALRDRILQSTVGFLRKSDRGR